MSRARDASAPPPARKAGRRAGPARSCAAWRRDRALRTTRRPRRSPAAAPPPPWQGRRRATPPAGRSSARGCSAAGTGCLEEGRVEGQQRHRREHLHDEAAGLRQRRRLGIVAEAERGEEAPDRRAVAEQRSLAGATERRLHAAAAPAHQRRGDAIDRPGTAIVGHDGRLVDAEEGQRAWSVPLQDVGQGGIEADEHRRFEARRAAIDDDRADRAGFQPIVGPRRIEADVARRHPAARRRVGRARSGQPRMKAGTSAAGIGLAKK